MGKKKSGLMNYIKGKIKNRRTDVELASNESLKETKRFSKWQEFRIAADIYFQDFKNKFKSKNWAGKVGYIAAGAAIPVSALSVAAIVESVNNVSDYSFDEQTIYSEYLEASNSKAVNLKQIEDVLDVFERDKGAMNYVKEIYSANIKGIKDFSQKDLVLIDQNYQQINCSPMTWMGGNFSTSEGFCEMLDDLVVKINTAFEEENGLVENIQIREAVGLGCDEHIKQLKEISENIKQDIGLVVGFIGKIKEINASHNLKDLDEAKNTLQSYMKRAQIILADKVFTDPSIIEIVSSSNERGGIIEGILNYNGGQELIEITNSRMASLSNNLADTQSLLESCDENDFVAIKEKVQNMFISIENDVQILEACKTFTGNIYSQEMESKNK